MPVAAADLVLYNAAAMVDADTGAQGGAIDTLRRPDFTQIAADDDIEAVSTAAGDTTQTLTIEARKADGTVVSETKTLTGTTAIVFSTIGVVERVLKAELSATCAGTITVRRSVAGATLRVIPIGERGFVMPFRKCSSDPSVQKDYFAKLFWKNTHATLALLGATVKQNADPTGFVTHLLAATTGDTATSTNRVTAPAAADTQDPDTFDDTDKAVPGTDLAAGGTIGVWLRLRLPAATAPQRSTYTSELAGSTT